MKTSHLIVLVASIAVIIALFFVLYVSGASLVPSLAGQGTAMTPASGTGLVGNRLPYFDLPNLTGDHVRSTDFTDTPLVIVFWSTWNAQSADEMHVLDQYLTDQSSHNQLVKIVAIDSQEDKSVVSSFMSRGGYQVPTLLDARGITTETYDIKSLPAFYFVDRTGTVREVYAGAMSQATLMNKIENILQ
jgi:cytochrome oxidase Cu insertion factor (SCO1/SenC/PrrC family)